jgi:hypothetical protein
MHITTAHLMTDFTHHGVIADGDRVKTGPHRSYTARCTSGVRAVLTCLRALLMRSANGFDATAFGKHAQEDVKRKIRTGSSGEGARQCVCGKNCGF